MICSPNEKNIAGQKHGKLTAIKRDFSKTTNEPYWWFSCECGNVKSINKKAFTQKRSNACGDCSKERVDITGQKFGRLTAIERDWSKQGAEVFWWFKCDCGNTKSINKKKFTQKKTLSCGCVQKDKAKVAMMVFNKEQGKNIHLSSNDLLYDVWKSMKQRCFNPKNKDYGKYGGRGITVCDEWANSFEQFFADMGERPIGGTIERIDNNKGYYPNNCRWATMKEQCNNRSTNRAIVVDGVKYKTISEAEEKTNYTRAQIRHNFS